MYHVKLSRYPLGDDMDRHWIPLASIPREGRLIELSDQALWETPIAEFGIACRIVEPLCAQMRLTPHDQGILVQGRLTGAVALACSLCTEDSVIVLEQRFDSFEPLPPDPLSQGKNREEEQAHDVDEAVVRLVPQGDYEVNPAALAWEEFSLALPAHPLCRRDCKGLCPVCGTNRNKEACSCLFAEGDHRLKVLREIRVDREQKG